MVTDIDHLVLKNSFTIVHSVLMSFWIVELGTVDSLAVEKADELFSFINTPLHLGLQAFDCNRFELAKG